MNQNRLASPVRVRALGAAATAAALVTLAACGGPGGPGPMGGFGGARDAGPAPGVIATRSPHSPEATVARLEAQLKQRNLGVAAKVDHAGAARTVGQTLRPTTLLIFGNPQAGTPLMQCAQTVGIDLPMKALVWVDAQGQTWLGYNDPAWIVHRHGGGDCPAAANVQKALAAIAAATVAP
jgi:uncharacterized protein (DUF302 family)